MHQLSICKYMHTCYDKIINMANGIDLSSRNTYYIISQTYVIHTMWRLTNHYLLFGMGFRSHLEAIIGKFKCRFRLEMLLLRLAPIEVWRKVSNHTHSAFIEDICQQMVNSCLIRSPMNWTIRYKTPSQRLHVGVRIVLFFSSSKVQANHIFRCSNRDDIGKNVDWRC